MPTKPSAMIGSVAAPAALVPGALPAPPGVGREPRSVAVPLPAGSPVGGARCCAFLLEDFPAWAAARLRPELEGVAFAVASRDQLLALSPAARALEIEMRWSVTRLRSLHPEVKIRPRHPAGESVAWEQVLAYLARLSPYVESTRPGLAFLDLPAAEQLCPLLARLRAQGGVACDRAGAELAAHGAVPGELQRVPGATAAFLRTVPLAMLVHVGVSADTLERLNWFGWSTVADLRPLTRQQLEAQFPEGALLYQYAQAVDARPIALYRPAPRLSARLVFPEPVREPAEWQGALECLMADLTRALGECKAFGVTVCLETSAGRRQERTFLREATSTRRTLGAAAERLLTAQLADGAELEAIRIVLSGLVARRSHQTSLFETGRHESVIDLAETLHSVEARYPGLVRRISINLPDAYLPEERFEWESLTEAELKPKGGKTRNAPGRKRRAAAPKP